MRTSIYCVPLFFGEEEEEEEDVIVAIISSLAFARYIISIFTNFIDRVMCPSALYSSSLGLTSP